LIVQTRRRRLRQSTLRRPRLEQSCEQSSRWRCVHGWQHADSRVLMRSGTNVEDLQLLARVNTRRWSAGATTLQVREHFEEVPLLLRVYAKNR
jgi:hypothetical protein